VAWILNGTGSEFNVTWDGANNRILLSPNAPYVKVGGEMSDTIAAVKKLSPSTAAVAVGNKTVQLTGYNVNDNNYYKLRDIGDALGFAVDWDPEGVVVIRSAEKTTDDSKNDTSDNNNGGNNSNNNTGNDGQTAETAASWTFNGAGWGHSVGMSQWGAYAMAKQGFSYEDILKFYFTGIEVSK
jgi:SpoIID/LytB domain protein